MRLLLTITICAAFVASGCGDDDRGAAGTSAGNGADGGSGGSGGSGGAGTGGSGGSGGSTDAGVFPTDDAGHVLCGSTPCKCHNGIDDDNDGQVDGADVECTGPYDDDEGTFATGIPGDNIDSCQDCFFDGNSGQGNDGCAYPTECLYGGMPAGQGGSDCHDCEVSERCVDFCLERTPNGCDCFGCCGVRNSQGDVVNVVLASTCSLEDIDDEEKCPRCVPATNGCSNECEHCEICPGMSVDDLPDDCYGNPPDSGVPTYPPQTCDNDKQPCDLEHPCPSTWYCLQGCCLPIVE